MTPIHLTAVIPARYKSSRLPYKILHKLDGKTMLQWVYERTMQAKGVDNVVIATDHELILDEAASFGAKAMMTSENHQSGTDRIAEAAGTFSDTDVFINVQGDQPFVEPEMIEKLIAPYLNGIETDMATLACPLDKEGISSPHTVKLAVNKQNYAMFFTRSPIPYFRQDIENVPVFQHIGLYAYTAEALSKISTLEPSKLEIAEGLEQMRALEAGYCIYVAEYDEAVMEINTLDDIKNALNVGLIENYKLFRE